MSKEWKNLYLNDKKEFHGKDIDLLESNIEVVIKASMVFWKLKRLNEKADKGMDDNTIDEIGRIVNGTIEGLPNGYDKRRKY